MNRYLRASARCDLVSGRSAPSAQVATPDRHRWKSVNRLRGSSPGVCNFQLSKPCNFRLTLTGRAGLSGTLAAYELFRPRLLPIEICLGDLHRSGVDQHTWEVQGKSCQLERVGRVCGFDVREWDSSGTDPLLGQNPDEVGQQLADWSRDGRVKALVLLSRADRIPAHDATLGGNSGLAQTHARTVRDEVSEHPTLSEVVKHRTILLGTGPLNVPTRCMREDSDCNDKQARRADRAVDVFACQTPDDAEDAKSQPEGEETSKCRGPAGLRRDDLEARADQPVRATQQSLSGR